MPSLLLSVVYLLPKVLVSTLVALQNQLALWAWVFSKAPQLHVGHVPGRELLVLGKSFQTRMFCGERGLPQSEPFCLYFLKTKDPKSEKNQSFETISLQYFLDFIYVTCTQPLALVCLEVLFYQVSSMSLVGYFIFKSMRPLASVSLSLTSRVFLWTLLVSHLFLPQILITGESLRLAFERGYCVKSGQGRHFVYS